MKPESRLQRRIRRALQKEFGGWWRKIWGGPYQEAGIPDLIGCVKGKFFAFEVKQPAKKHQPSDLQRREIRLINKAKGHAAVVRSVPQALSIVKETLNGNDSPIKSQKRKPEA